MTWSVIEPATGTVNVYECFAPSSVDVQPALLPYTTAAAGQHSRRGRRVRRRSLEILQNRFPTSSSLPFLP
ncbi:hypothetical protein [Methanosphaerula palustris]|uniref:hypothetical protein n=1 Tax=Methanosphaerula palustris TaxID=475088 RepID=UPI0011D0E25F|nr:hypothetical protein [Methanosphaerula palustris]